LVELDAPEAAGLADDIDGTHLARCFARIVDWLDSAPEAFLLWCHLTALGGPWDAPMEFRLRCTEPDDPDPPDSAEVPWRVLEHDYDPDELLGVTQSYAGQVLLLDTCLGALWEFLDSSPAGRDTLVILLSARGFPLGEHRYIGGCGGGLYGELVHVPLMLRLPDRAGAAGRSQALVHPIDLWATLLDWWEVRAIPEAPGADSLLPLVRDAAPAPRDRLCLTDGAHEEAIRTPAWYLRDAGSLELFAKPDDRWEANDVADRCAQVIDPLRSAFSEFQTALQTGKLDEVAPLDEVLLHGLE
jgi:arylsulfatase A-like enzyme